MDQIFAVRMTEEIYLAKGNKLYPALRYLEKGSDRIEWNDLWNVSMKYRGTTDEWHESLL